MIPQACGSAWLCLAFLPTAQAQDSRTDPATAPGYALVTLAARHIRDELTFEYLAPKLKAREWVIYMSRLPELPWQSEVSSAMLPGGRPARELSLASRPSLFTRIPVQGANGQNNLTIRVEYEANLRKRKLMRRGAETQDVPHVPPLTAQERKNWLAAGRQFDFKSAGFSAWFEANGLKRKPGEVEVDCARRNFLTIKEKFEVIEGDDRLVRVASRTIEAGKSDDIGLAILYVATLRANGIPARVASGRWARPKEDGGIAPAEGHARAEFFAGGVGWVPADPAMAIVFDKSEEGLEFFGVDEADFLTMHHDLDLEYDSIYFGRKTVESAQGPLFWVVADGTFDDFRILVSSKIVSRPLDLAEPFPKPGVRKPEPATGGEAKEGVTAFGIMTVREDDAIEVKVDGEEKPGRYEFDPLADRKLATDLRTIFPVTRVQLTYQAKGEGRQLLKVKKAATKLSGTVVGEVVEAHEWWVEVRPKNGSPDGYAANMPQEKWDATTGVIKSLKAGDLVTIRYTSDFERHRIESIRKLDRPGK